MLLWSEALCIKIFKTLNNINPAFMNEIFEHEITKKVFGN